MPLRNLRFAFRCRLAYEGLKFEFALLTLPTFWVQESQPAIMNRDDAIRNLAPAFVCLACYKK
jgi:hypothetical protein